MAVELKISVQENCDSIYLFDLTGKYDKDCNPTGWCSPNEEILSANTAEIHVYPPGSNSPIILDVYPDFPNSDNVGYEILPVDLGMENFKSGVWRFDYQVRITDDNVLIFTSCHKLLVEDLKCCLEGKRIAVTVDNFESKEVIASNNVFALFESAEANACQGKKDESDKIITTLYNKCNCSC